MLFVTMEMTKHSLGHHTLSAGGRWTYMQPTGVSKLVSIVGLTSISNILGVSFVLMSGLMCHFYPVSKHKYLSANKRNIVS